MNAEDAIALELLPAGALVSQLVADIPTARVLLVVREADGTLIVCEDPEHTANLRSAL